MRRKSIFEGAERLKHMYFSPIRIVGEKAAEMRKQGYDVISFSAGEPDFNTPFQIKEQTIAAIKNDLTHYAPNRGILELRREICERLEKNCHVSYDPETEIILTCGGAEAVNNAFLAVVDPGDEVIIFTPGFMNYENMILMAGGTVVDIPLSREDQFQINLDVLKSRITDKTKMIVLNNPCNPTGVVYDKKVLEGVARLAVEHDLMVFSDEIYNEITYDGAVCYSIASFPGMKERTITMNGFSKAFAMTGWRLGYLAADARILPNLLKVHQYTTTCTPTFIQHGLISTMNGDETQKEMSAMVGAFARRRSLLLSRLDSIDGISYIKPMGAFYCFVDVSGTGLSGEEFAARLLDEKYVAVVPGIKLGRTCSDFVRISFATSDENIAEGLKRMAEFVRESSKSKENLK